MEGEGEGARANRYTFVYVGRALPPRVMMSAEAGWLIESLCVLQPKTNIANAPQLYAYLKSIKSINNKDELNAIKYSINELWQMFANAVAANKNPATGQPVGRPRKVKSAQD